MPILAHPDRYRLVQADPGLLTPLVEQGILIQLTAGSLIGDFGPIAQQTAKILLCQGLVHIIASDSHGVHRPSRMGAAAAAAAHLVGPEQAHALVLDTPAAILADRRPPTADGGSLSAVGRLPSAVAKIG